MGFKNNKIWSKKEIGVFEDENSVTQLETKSVTVDKLYFLLQDINHRLENIESRMYENTISEEIIDEIEIYNNPQVMTEIKETIRKCDEDIKHGRTRDINDLIEQ